MSGNTQYLNLGIIKTDFDHGPLLNEFKGAMWAKNGAVARKEYLLRQVETGLMAETFGIAGLIRGIYETYAGAIDTTDEAVLRTAFTNALVGLYPELTYAVKPAAVPVQSEVAHQSPVPAEPTAAVPVSTPAVTPKQPEAPEPPRTLNIEMGVTRTPEQEAPVSAEAQPKFPFTKLITIKS